MSKSPQSKKSLPIISFTNVGKSFDIYREEKLKHSLTPFKRTKQWPIRQQKQPIKQQDLSQKQVLSQASFDIFPKQAVGLYGPNGSGKSTLMRLMAGILKPNIGKILVRGSVAPVLELGAGLHPDLTGWQNIKLYSALLGFAASSNDRLGKKIAQFVELGEYLNLPIKKYSSGMKSRLAFAIAVFSPADILLLDEVFAVGDREFIEKSQVIMRKLRHKKTIVLSSHDLQLIQDYCDRIIKLKDGRIDTSGQYAKLLLDLPIGSTFQAKIISNSMAPLIKIGDIVKVVRQKVSQVKRDDIVAVYFDNIGEIVIHRVLVKDGKQLILRGDNNLAPDRWMASEFNLLGKVQL